MATKPKPKPKAKPKARRPLAEPVLRPTFRRERRALNAGIFPVAGCDEAGRGPLAGPVVAAAVILDREKYPRGIDDSKVLPAPVREAICAKLYKVAVIGVGIASVEEIDRLNI